MAATIRPASEQSAPSLRVDALALAVAEEHVAQAFYASAFGGTVGRADDGRSMIALHNAGRISLSGSEESRGSAGASIDADFPGYVLTVTVHGTQAVEALAKAAEGAGATIVKPPKKSLFGGFSSVLRAPDGTVWKLAAESKDRGDARSTAPEETVVLLGVDSPKRSRAFYESLGMTVDRDYGNKYIDFELTGSEWRLALMRRKVLAKDVGLADEGGGFAGAMLIREVATPKEVDGVLAAASAAGGHVLLQGGQPASGGYSGRFTDPDGAMWTVRAR